MIKLKGKILSTFHSKKYLNERNKKYLCHCENILSPIDLWVTHTYLRCMMEKLIFLFPTFFNSTNVLQSSRLLSDQISVYNSVFDWMLHLTFNFLKVTGIVFHNLKNNRMELSYVSKGTKKAHKYKEYNIITMYMSLQLQCFWQVQKYHLLWYVAPTLLQFITKFQSQTARYLVKLKLRR